MNSDEPRGESAQVLGVVDESEPLFSGGVTKVVPIAEGGSRKAREEFIPKVVWRNFTGIFTAFQAEPNSKGLGTLAKTKKNFFHAGPAFMKGFFPCLNGSDLFTNISAGSDLACEGEGFQGIGQTPRPGRAKVKYDEAGSDGGGGLKGGEGVAFREATSCGVGVRKFVGVGVWAKKLDGDGAEVVQDIDLGCVRVSMFSEDSGPEVKAGVVAEFDSREAEGGGLAKKGGTVGGAVGVPAGGEGEGGGSHSRRASLKKGTGRRDFSGREGAGGVEDWERSRQNHGMLAKRISYRGKVQGVGFRYSVRQIAEGYTVSGHAMNQPDGTVEVFLQGDRGEVEAMEKEIGESHLAGFIREASGREVEAVLGVKGFQIQ